MALSINSAAFKQDGEIPKVYTCEGRDIAPPLQWEGVPAEAVLMGTYQKGCS